MNRASFKTCPVVLVVVLCLFTAIAWCEEPMRGPLPAEQREIIQYMAQHHEELIRKVKLRKDGYEASTTTDNEELARKLKQHFTYMKKRIGSGAMVRRWDPAFVELVKFHDQITTTVEYLDNGIKVVVTSDTPHGVKVAQNHARIVTGFTEKGAEAVREKHEAALDKEPAS
jgi:hypothetical protein